MGCGVCACMVLHVNCTEARIYQIYYACALKMQLDHRAWFGVRGGLQKEQKIMSSSRRQLEEEDLVRNVKQYAQVTNELADQCFRSCVCSVADRRLTTEELACVDSCAAKLISATTRIVLRVAELNPMGLGQQQPSMQQR